MTAYNVKLCYTGYAELPAIEAPTPEDALFAARMKAIRTPVFELVRSFDLQPWPEADMVEVAE